jgi:cytoskeletal protein CcmA (bactofilin family)
MWNYSPSPKPPVARPAAPNPPTATSDAKRAVGIGRSVAIKGEVICSEDLMIDGHLEGRLELQGHNLLLGPNALVQAHVDARIVTIMGTVTGNVTASEKVDLRGSGTVDGNIHAPRIAMADGAQVRGRIDSLSPVAPDQQLPLPMAV